MTNKSDGAPTTKAGKTAEDLAQNKMTTHELAAKVLESFAGPPPYICVRTEDDSACLLFFRDHSSGAYNTPPGGQRVSCSQCRFFYQMNN